MVQDMYTLGGVTWLACKARSTGWGSNGALQLVQSSDSGRYFLAIRQNFKTGKGLSPIALATYASWEIQNV